MESVIVMKLYWLHKVLMKCALNHSSEFAVIHWAELYTLCYHSTGRTLNTILILWTGRILRRSVSGKGCCES
jgi:hypothetical protein